MLTPAKEQLIAYFSGTLSEKDRRLIEDWLKKNPDRRLVEEAIALSFENMPDPKQEETEKYPPVHTLEAYARFRQLTEKKQSHPRKNAALRQIGLRYASAAAVLLFLAIGIFQYRHAFLSPARQQVATLRHPQQIRGAIAAVTVIRLADGSTARLFPHSSLTINDSFGTGNRIVELQGRAYFEVAQNAQYPFYVRSGAVSTRVLGTAFDIRTDKNNTTRIVVKEGKVQIADTGRILSDLAAGQGLSLDNPSGKWVVQSIDAKEYCQWTSGELTFRQIPLKDILQNLEEWFDVSFEVQNPTLLHKKLTFSLRGQNLHEAMDVLATTVGFRYRSPENARSIIIQ